MKKRVLGILTALAVMSLGITANAASASTTAVSTDTEVVMATETASSPTAGVTITDITNSFSAQAAAAAQDYFGAATIIVKTIIDITHSGATPNADGTYTVSVTFASVSPTHTYMVLHFLSDEGRWETLSATVSGGNIVFNTTSFSPFVIVETDGVTTAAATSNAEHEALLKAAQIAELQEKAAAANAANNANNANVVTSPKTAETPVFALVIVGAAAAAGIVAMRRRAR